MDEIYDQSQKPPYSPASTGEGVSYQSTSSKATVVANPALSKGFWSSTRSDAGGGSGNIYTVQICVNGSPKSLDVYVSGQPY